MLNKRFHSYFNESLSVRQFDFSLFCIKSLFFGNKPLF
ncbi:hypothetical protein CHCC20333_2717 [Bacillus paralicheniformis]|nr:hypothetical protein CHCC20333_2717 [Bacillus paralicheniformis]